MEIQLTNSMNLMNITIIQNNDGYLAQCSGVQGAFAEGDTEFEAFYNLVDVLHMIAEYKNIHFSKSPVQEFQVPFTFA